MSFLADWLNEGERYEKLPRFIPLHGTADWYGNADVPIHPNRLSSGDGQT